MMTTNNDSEKTPVSNTVSRLCQKLDGKKIKLIASLIVIGFVSLQTGFLYSAVYQNEDRVRIVGEEADRAYSAYNKFQRALIVDNQREIIFAFSEIYNSRNTISDLLLASHFQMALYNENPKRKEIKGLDPEMTEIYRHKWNMETKDYIIKIYLENPKAGIEKDLLLFKNISCVELDFPCKLIKHYFGNERRRDVKRIENLVNTKLQNIKNIDEYTVNYDKFMDDIRHGRPETNPNVQIKK